MGITKKYNAGGIKPSEIYKIERKKVKAFSLNTLFKL